MTLRTTWTVGGSIGASVLAALLALGPAAVRSGTGPAGNVSTATPPPAAAQAPAPASVPLSAPARPNVDPDGTVQSPGVMRVPVSGFLSPEARSRLAARLASAPSLSLATGMAALRQASDESAKAALDEWLKIHPSRIVSSVIDGVRVDTVTPLAGVAQRNEGRVLINAHMGGFMFGGRFGGALEAVPLAGTGRIKVIAVDYRLAPEHVFPAASEDLETIYRHALKTTPPERIGLYGCSAGGTLVAQSVAWFQERKLPLPGAIGIFCSGAMPSFWFGGDSAQLSPLLNASLPAGPGRPANAPRDYFAGADLNDPRVTPGLFPEVLAKFPPTLIVTGTRDVAMSNALVTHARLLEAGADASLFVQEGLGHGHFFAFPGTPESAAAHRVIWKFFDTHLK